MIFRLDAVNEQIFSEIAGKTEQQCTAAETIDFIEETCTLPDSRVFVDCVPCGLNDSDLVSIADLARNHELQVRFISQIPSKKILADGGGYRSRDTVFNLMQRTFGTLVQTADEPYESCTVAGFKGTIAFITRPAPQI